MGFSGPLHTKTSVFLVKIIDSITFIPFVNVNNLDWDHRDATSVPLELNSLFCLSTPDFHHFNEVTWVGLLFREPTVQGKTAVWECMCEPPSWWQINIYKFATIYCTYSIFPVRVNWFKMSFSIMACLLKLLNVPNSHFSQFFPYIHIKKTSLSSMLQLYDPRLK